MDKYEVICHIGKGYFGSISKIRRIEDGKILVWKELDYGRLNEKEKQHIVSEVNILRELRHSNIIKYYDRIIDKKNTRIYIVMEYCEGGDIGQLIKRCRKTKDYISEDVIWKVFTQVVMALHTCHNYKEGKVLHRDIKPSNIFLDAENNAKLGDFGLSRILSNESNFAYSNVGTPYYMSPEQIDELKYNEKSDIWSLGCFLYEMACLKPPFQATNHLSLALKIKSGKVERIDTRYSDELNRVIVWMMNSNRDSRPSSNELLNIPQVSLRVREKRLKENYSKLKKIEVNIKAKERQLELRELELNQREKNLIHREELLIQKEEMLIENNLVTINNEDIYQNPIKQNLAFNNYLTKQHQTTRKSNYSTIVLPSSTIEPNLINSYEEITTSQAVNPIKQTVNYNSYKKGNNTANELIYGEAHQIYNDDYKQSSNLYGNNDSIELLSFTPPTKNNYSYPKKRLSFKFDPSIYNDSLNRNQENYHTNCSIIEHHNNEMNSYKKLPLKGNFLKKLRNGTNQNSLLDYSNNSPLKRGKQSSRQTPFPRNNSYNFTHTTISSHHNNTSYKTSYLNDT